MGLASFDFYEALAEHYHLLFEDWNQSIERQGKALNAILHSMLRRSPLKILDCAFGIGTQAIGFAQARHQGVASDFSPTALQPARGGAGQPGLEIPLAVSG